MRLIMNINEVVDTLVANGDDQGPGCKPTGGQQHQMTKFGSNF